LKILIDIKISLYIRKTNWPSAIGSTNPNMRDRTKKTIGPVVFAPVTNPNMRDRTKKPIGPVVFAPVTNPNMRDRTKKTIGPVVFAPVTNPNMRDRTKKPIGPAVVFARYQSKHAHDRTKRIG
jgi:hypothetical protein